MFFLQTYIKGLRLLVNKWSIIIFALILLIVLNAILKPAQQINAASNAQNVIIFIGDGMGAEHIKAGGMFANGQAGTLAFESFEYQTTMTHDNIYGSVTDSAASATALATGKKVINGAISQHSNGIALTTLLELYQHQGKSAGLVTTSYMSDASPAAFGAHESSRDNRVQIVNDYLTQTRPNVLFGGGGHGWTTSHTSDAGYTTVINKSGLQEIDTEKITHIAGVFGSGEIIPAGLRKHNPNMPSLADMTETAIDILDNDTDGFFLVVEHEGSDTFSHKNNTNGMVRSVAELSAAVQKAVDWKANNPNTIIIVTADHETGGMKVTEESPRAGQIPSVHWSTLGHTRTPIPVYATGIDAYQITGQLIDNTDIFDMLKPSSLVLGDRRVKQGFHVNNNGYSREIAVVGNDTQWENGSGTWRGPYSINALPGSGDIQASAGYVICNRLRQGIWRNNEAYSRSAPIENGQPNWRKATSWGGPYHIDRNVKLPGSGDIQTLATYVIGNTVYQGIWRGNQGFTRQAPIKNCAPDWRNATAWKGPLSINNLPGSGELQSISSHVVDDILYQEIWRGNQGYRRNVPIINGQRKWQDAPWSRPISKSEYPGSGDIQAMVGYVLEK